MPEASIITFGQDSTEKARPVSLRDVDSPAPVGCSFSQKRRIEPSLILLVAVCITAAAATDAHSHLLTIEARYFNHAGRGAGREVQPSSTQRHPHPKLKAHLLHPQRDVVFLHFSTHHPLPLPLSPSLSFSLLSLSLSLPLSPHLSLSSLPPVSNSTNSLSKSKSRIPRCGKRLCY